MRGNLRSSSLVYALAARERDGCSSRINETLSRRRWAMSQALSPDDCAVLLGFSSDGNYLLYYSVCESSYVVHWKRIKSALSSERLELQLALQLPVGKHESTARNFGEPNVGSSLRVWQTVDHQLVAVIAANTSIASQDSGPTYHLTLSPSPFYRSMRAAPRISGLTFVQALPSPTQELEPWQLQSMGRGAYLLLLNMGSSVTVLALRIRETFANQTPLFPPMNFTYHFGDRPWYSESEYPIEFVSEEFVSSTTSSGSANVECVWQHQFDCEAFLADFFRKYAAFRHMHLVDYDLQLVRINIAEELLFMTCTADLESTRSISRQHIEQTRLVLFFALSIFTGQYHVMRALKVPRQQLLRRMSAVFARKLAADLLGRGPEDHSSTEWNNDPVQRGISLEALHNPIFPVSIILS